MLKLERMRTAFDRAFRNEQNENLQKIEEANNVLESKMDSLISGEIDNVALQTDIEQKLNDLETQYAPKLTEVSEQLSDIATIAKDDIQSVINSATNKILIPSGEFKITSPLVLKSGISIEGDKPIEGSGELTSKIVLNGQNAFVSDTTDRIRINLKNIHVVGTGTEKGLNFKFGGRIENCYFEKLDIAIDNPESYLTQFVNCSFVDCNIGLSVDVVKAMSVDSCFFNRNKIGAKFGSLSSVSGYNNTSLSITNCSLNMNNGSTDGFIIHGGASLDTCYFETFGTPAPDSTFVNFIISKFGTASIDMKNCDIDGHDKTLNGIKISLEPGQTGGFVAGDISLNRIVRVTNQLLYGSQNDIEGINVHNNNPEIIEINRHSQRAYKPIASSVILNGVDCSGATYVSIPLNKSITYDNSEVFDSTTGNYRCPKSGVYRITGTIVFSHSVDTKGVEVRIRRDGSQIGDTIVTSSKFISATTYSTIYVEQIAYLNKSVVIDLQARNAGTTFKGNFSCEFISK